MHCPTVAELPPLPLNKTGWPWANDRSPQLPGAMPDGSSWPRISLVTPSYNQGQFIEETIRSVLLQGYPNLEYIVIDGGSADNSVEIIRKYEPWLTYWISEPDRGQSEAINKGLSRATGTIYAWLNSDDLLLPGALAHMAQMYRQYPEAAAWVGRCYRITPAKEILSLVTPQNLDRASLANWWRIGRFYQPACFFSAQHFTRTEGLDESLYIALDIDLWLKLAEHGEFVATDRAIAAAVIHENAKTQLDRSKLHLEMMLIQVKHGYKEIALDRLRRIMQPPYAPEKLAHLIEQSLTQVQSLLSRKLRRQVLADAISQLDA
jgi:glycosyltransferase involved in cell wall biosynthesis